MLDSFGMAFLLYKLLEVSQIRHTNTFVYIRMNEKVNYKVDYCVVFKLMFSVLLYDSSHLNSDAFVVHASVVFRF